MTNKTQHEQVDEIKSMTPKEILNLFEGDDRKTVAGYLLVEQYVKDINDNLEFLVQTKKRPHKKSNHLLETQFPLAMQDKPWWDKNYQDLRSKKITIIEFMSYFIEWIRNKRTAFKSGMDNL